MSNRDLKPANVLHACSDFEVEPRRPTTCREYADYGEALRDCVFKLTRTGYEFDRAHWLATEWLDRRPWLWSAAPEPKRVKWPAEDSEL